MREGSTTTRGGRSAAGGMGAADWDGKGGDDRVRVRFRGCGGGGGGGRVMEGGRVSNIHATIKEEGVRVLEDWR